MAKQVSYHGKYQSLVVSEVSLRKIKDAVDMKVAEVEDRIIYRLRAIGEECVKIAREDHSNNWGDISGNLRSSIGYAIFKDGQAIQPYVPQIYAGPKGDGKEGAAAAAALMNKLQSQHRRGIVLYVCAGMNYAVFVENVHHKDVMASARLLMEKLAKEELSEVTEDV